MKKKAKGKKKQIKKTVRKFDKARARSKKAKVNKVFAGKFSGSGDGYGFITADPAYAEEFDGDIFVPAKYTGTATDGDTVKFIRVEYNGRPEAHITSVSERGARNFTGVYKYTRLREGNRLTVSHRIIPDNRRLGFEIYVSPSNVNGAADNDKVLCEFIQYPDASDTTPARVKIVKTYGNADELMPNVEAALDQSGIPVAFPPDVLAEADAASHRRIYKKGRLDLTKTTVFTIDGEYSKDMDDAVSVQKSGDGYVLGVHIADVAEYVSHDSKTDKEAYERGTSVYFADRVIPMLPQSLSNVACSLNPNANRYALSAFINIDNDGEILDCTVTASVIRSCVRGVYSEINDLIDNRETSKYKRKYAKIVNDGILDTLISLYRALLSKSQRRHALELESTEIVFLMDENGGISDIRPAQRGISERMIEQFMLAANEGVASLLNRRGLPCVYRTHGKPDSERLHALSELAVSYGIDPSPVLKEDISLYDIEKFLDSSEENGVREIMSYMVLRCMMKAKYSADHAPHFGIGSPCYCHFTSPIRRYPDLVVHRIIRSLLINEGGDVSTLSSYAEKAAYRCNDCEQRAVKLERDMDDLYAACYMKDKIGQAYCATIVTVLKNGFFARLENRAEVFCPVSETFSEFDAASQALSANGKRYRPGDTVSVVIKHVSMSSKKTEAEVIL